MNGVKNNYKIGGNNMNSKKILFINSLKNISNLIINPFYSMQKLKQIKP